MKLLAAFFLCKVHVPILTCAQSEGDVRLVGTGFTNRGRLEIYWQGKWGTFCKISRGGAAAACKQLGFNYIFNYASYEYRSGLGFNVTRATEDTPIAIANTYCPDISVPQHVLRCPFSSQVPSYCTHDYDIILYCASSLWQHPYETEVRLNSSTYLSTGTSEIFVNGTWGNVCGSKFDKGAADSTCRQMGYTGATTFSTSSKATTPTTWLTGVSCASKGHSCSCLNGCFGKAPSKPTSCGNTNYVHVTCTFDVKVANSTKAGNYDDCSQYQSTCSQGSGGAGSAGIAVAIVIVVLVVLAVSIIIVAIVTFFAVSAYRKRGYYAVSTN